jgi:hypothetical protein
VGASTSWNPQGLSSPVMGLLYLYFHIKTQTLPQNMHHNSDVILFTQGIMADNFLFTNYSRPALGLTYYYPGGDSQTVKCRGWKVDHLPPSNTDFSTRETLRHAEEKRKVTNAPYWRSITGLSVHTLLTTSIASYQLLAI